MNKRIRSKEVRESLLDYSTLAASLRENTESAVKALLSETVRDTYAKLLSEDDDKDYEEDEVEDTSVDIETDGAETEVDATDIVDGAGDAGMESASDTEVDTEVETGGDDAADGEAEETEVEVADDGEDEWAEFDKYKVSDDEYDFTGAEDEEIVKVYKLLKNDDQVLVHKDDSGNVNIQDNETGAEYLVNLGGSGSASAGMEGGAEYETEFESNDFDDMNESTERLFELVLEYDSNVGYTDNYQKKDVMTNPGMSEPGKNVNDWDAGVPKDSAKPWSGYPGKKKKADKPFDAGKGKQVEESLDDIEEPVEEATNVGGFVQQNSTSKSHVPNSSGRSARSASKGGKRVKGTTTPRYSGAEEGNVSESLVKRMNAALRENEELKGGLKGLMEELRKVSVTNHNLAQIIKLVSENTTSQDEKKEIIARFRNEGKTIESSAALYETISRELKKSNKMSITEGASLTVESSSKVNETPIYKSKDMMDSLDLMHRMMK